MDGGKAKVDGKNNALLTVKNSNSGEVEAMSISKIAQGGYGQRGIKRTGKQTKSRTAIGWRHSLKNSRPNYRGALLGKQVINGTRGTTLWKNKSTIDCKKESARKKKRTKTAKGGPAKRREVVS